MLIFFPTILKSNFFQIIRIPDETSKPQHRRSHGCSPTPDGHPPIPPAPLPVHAPAPNAPLLAPLDGSPQLCPVCVFIVVQPHEPAPIPLLPSDALGIGQSQHGEGASWSQWEAWERAVFCCW